MLCKVVYFFGFLRLLPKTCNFCRLESVFFAVFFIVRSLQLVEYQQRKNFLYYFCGVLKKLYFCFVKLHSNKRTNKNNKVMKKQRKEKRLKRKAAARKRMIELEAYLDYITEYKNK